MTDKTQNCCFCGKNARDVKKILTGLNSSICNECVALCNEAMQKEKTTDLGKTEIIPKKIFSNLDEYVIGQHTAKKVLAVSIYNHFKRLQDTSTDAVEVAKSNILMIGPTGCGKTLMAQILAKMLDVPFVIADATTLTEAGYVGEDVEHILAQLLHAADNDIERAQKGIVYVDEIDKISRKSESPSITRDVSGEGVQQALLKLMEGTLASIPPQGGRKHPQQELIKIDTKNILFICSGAFTGLNKIIRNRQKSGSIGFEAKVYKKEVINNESIVNGVEPEDLVKYGLIPEFIGRLPQIVTIEDLDEDMLVRVLNEPKNSVIKQYKKLFSFQNVKLEIDAEAQKEIAKIALKRKTGARALKAILENVLLDTMFEMPSMKNLSEVIVSKDTVISKICPKYIMNNKSTQKNKKIHSQAS